MLNVAVPLAVVVRRHRVALQKLLSLQPKAQALGVQVLVTHLTIRRAVMEGWGWKHRTHHMRKRRSHQVNSLLTWPVKPIQTIQQ